MSRPAEFVITTRRMDAPSSSEQLDPVNSSSLRRSASARLHAMRTDPSGTCADVELRAGDFVIRAHRSVLTTYEYFRNLFGDGSAFSEAATGGVDFEDVSPEALQIVVEYIYEYPLDPGAGFPFLDEVWSFATVHLMDDLVASVRDLLMTVATPDCFLHLLRHAVQLQDAIGMEASANLVTKRIDDHDFCSDINDCGYDELLVLKTWCPKQKMPQWSHLVLTWMVKDPTDRHLDAERLLDSVDFASMSSEHLAMLNKDFGCQSDDPVLRVERKLRDALLGRMDRIIDRREAMLKSICQKILLFYLCSQDECSCNSSAVCRFEGSMSEKNCYYCGRLQCDGAFTTSGTCASCGRRRRGSTPVTPEDVENFVSSLKDL